MLNKLSVDQILVKAKSYQKKGEILESQKLYNSILRVFPKNKRAQNGLDTLKIYKLNNVDINPPQEVINKLINLYNQGHLSNAIGQAESLTEQYPKAFIIWNILGASHIGLGRIMEASEAFKKVTEINPNYADGFNNLGSTLQLQGKLDKAIQVYNKALLLKPDYAEVYTNIGNTLKDQGKLDDAIQSYNKALKLKPDYADNYYNMGIAFQGLDNLEKALESYQMALSLKPDQPETYNNIGNTLKDLGEMDKALEAYQKAFSLNSSHAGAYYNCSIIYNLKGDLEKGLKLYEWRLKIKDNKIITPKQNLIWDKKKSLNRKNFLVYEEQGLGDIIQFCRYLLLLKQKGAKVIFKVKKKMHALLKTIDSDFIFVDNSEIINLKVDFETTLMSLPFLFNTNLGTIPTMTSYLFPDRNKVDLWSKNLKKSSFKIGICWQGSKKGVAYGRSFPLSLFKCISKLPNVELISLQKGEGEEQIKDIDFKLTTLGNNFDTGKDAFIDTAGIMANCDLIITCDTAIAHLAGALGYPTWLALKKIPEWYWMLDGNNSVFYPSITLYRQKERGNWKNVFDTMHKDLKLQLK